MRKTLLILTIFSSLLFNCASDNEDVIIEETENQNPELANEYVLLIPRSKPIAVVEKNENEVLLAYFDISVGLNKICQINDNGDIQWETDLQMNSNIWTGQLFVENGSIYFFYIGLGNSGLQLSKLDLEGNLVTSNFTSNQNYNNLNLRKTENGFIAVNNSSNSVAYDEYSSNGSLLNSYTLNFSNSQAFSSNVIRKNNQSYLFRYYNYNNPVYEDFDCSIFDSNGSLIHTISMTGLEETGNIYSSFPISNEEVLMVTNETDVNGRLVHLNKFNNSGTLISSNIIDNLNRDSSLSLLSNNTICFLGQKSSTQPGKKLNLKILNTSLEVISDKYIGSTDNIGTFDVKCEDSSNFNYIYGITDSSTGDFDLPNNSTSTDLFFFRLNK